ncbi:MAG: 6-bladed beta-propeller, partial [Vicinamibacterales bacterium]
MKRLCLAGAVLLSAVSLIAQAPGQGTLTPAQLALKATAQGVPEIPFESAPNFLKLPPNLYLGEGIGVARNSKGHVFVYTRSGESSRLFQFDQSGAFVREIGRGLYGFVMAHAVRVDGQDNIWTVDEGANTVVKFNPEGRVEMVLGRREESVEGLIPTATPIPPAQPYRLN